MVGFKARTRTCTGTDRWIYKPWIHACNSPVICCPMYLSYLDIDCQGAFRVNYTLLYALYLISKKRFGLYNARWRFMAFFVWRRGRTMHYSWQWYIYIYKFNNAYHTLLYYYLYMVNHYEYFFLPFVWYLQ